MQAETFTLNFEDHTITVQFLDGSIKVYTDSVSYLADFPDRQGDTEVWAELTKEL